MIATIPGCGTERTRRLAARLVSLPAFGFPASSSSSSSSSSTLTGISTDLSTGEQDRARHPGEHAAGGEAHRGQDDEAAAIAGDRGASPEGGARLRRPPPFFLLTNVGRRSARLLAPARPRRSLSRAPLADDEKIVTH